MAKSGEPWDTTRKYESDAILKFCTREGLQNGDWLSVFCVALVLLGTVAE